MKQFNAVRVAAISSAVFSALAIAVPAQAQTPDAEKLNQLIKAAQAEKSVMIYGTSPIEQIGPVFKAFEAKYGITLENFRASGSPLITRLANEAATGIMHADVLMGSEIQLQVEHPEYFQKLGAANFPDWSKIPETAKLPPGNLSISYIASVYALFYNTNKTNDAARPKTWEDLPDPKWKGQTVLIDPRASAAYRTTFSIIRKQHPGLLQRLAANEPRLTDAGPSAAQQLAAGTGTIAYPGALSNAEVLMEKGAPIMATPLGGPQLSRRNWVSAVAGPHPKAALLFTHYMLLGDGLTIYCKTNSTQSSIMDANGKDHGCVPLATDAQFLPEEPISKEESAIVLKELKLE